MTLVCFVSHNGNIEVTYTRDGEMLRDAPLNEMLGELEISEEDGLLKQKVEL
jgi:hypothetical protein